MVRRSVQFDPGGEDSKRYAFISCVVKRLRYRRRVRADKRIVLRYLERTTGYSRQHLTRMVRRALQGEILAKRYTSLQRGFARTFLAADVAFLRPPWMAEAGRSPRLHKLLTILNAMIKSMTPWCDKFAIQA